MFFQKVASSPFRIKPEVLPPGSAAVKWHFTKFSFGWVKNLVRLDGDGKSRMNRCNQRKQILDVCQVNCYHQFVVNVKQVVRHLNAVAEGMGSSGLYSCLWRMSGTKLFKLIWSRNWWRYPTISVCAKLFNYLITYLITYVQLFIIYLIYLFNLMTQEPLWEGSVHPQNFLWWSS